MTASSVATYLDVTQAASPKPQVATATPSEPGTENAAKVLAAIHAGDEVVAEVPDKTGLPMEQVLGAVAWLAEAGLITVDRSDGTLRAQLTEPVKAALERT